MTTESEPISFACPECNAVLEAQPHAAGRIIECPECGAGMEVPQPEVSPETGNVSGRKVIKRSKSQLRRSGASPSQAGRRSGPSPSITPTGIRKPQKSPMGKIVVILLLLLGSAGGYYYYTNQQNGEGGRFGGLLARNTGGSGGGGGRRLRAGGPMGPQTQPPSANRWNVNERANVTAYQWGGSGNDRPAHMVARANGNMVIVGTLASRDAIPSAAGQRHTLFDDQGDEHFGFVAEISADGQNILWHSTFGGNIIRPTTVALSPEGDILIGGQILERGRGHRDIEGDFSGRQAGIGRIAADGSRVLWMREGGPNQNHVTSIATDEQGRIYYTAGGRGQGQTAYVLRLKPDGTSSNFPRGNADGSEVWGLYFDVRHETFKAEGQIGAFYAKGTQGAGYDYDGPDGPWGPVRFFLHGIREGGQIVFLPDGDFVVTGTLQYDFREGSNRRFPAFDLIMARYTQEGRLVWSTNLYREGDSIHTPDQKSRHLVYNPHNGDLYVLAVQHGSNIYRFVGELLGDTGNLMITWIGRVDAENGNLKAGWYWQNNRNGQYNDRGSPRSPPHPRLAGNSPGSLAVDDQGRIYMAGSAGAQAFTTPTAWKDWPSAQTGGGNPALVILSPELDRIHYATMIRGENHDNGGGEAVIVNDHGVWVTGNNGTRGFPAGNAPDWSNAQPAGDRDLFMVNFRFDSRAP
ncbi:MAG: hypothetical protein JJU29_10230 [Verrucomicrobia bacterium]|nr:hypothetical protein [Verrucomicrobiota bacterium]MCH8510614.1 hypothetical protein [Kiritimatiellia bacterium]